MEEELNEEVIEKKDKKRSVSKNSIGTRVLAAVLAFLMVGSLAATVVSFIVRK